MKARDNMASKKKKSSKKTDSPKKGKAIIPPAKRETLSPLQKAVKDIETEVLQRLKEIKEDVAERNARYQMLINGENERHRNVVKEQKRFLKESLLRLKADENAEKAKLVLAIKSAKVIEPLTKLKTSAEVAKFLKDRKIKGIVGDTKRCPVAAYLNENAPKGADVEVQTENLTLDGITIDNPEGVSNFVSEFDNEEDHQELNENPSSHDDEDDDD